MRVRRVRPTIHLSLRERRAVMRKRTQMTGANTRPAQNIETWGEGEEVEEEWWKWRRRK